MRAWTTGLLSFALVVGCGSKHGAESEAALRRDDLPRVRTWLLEDGVKHQKGVVAAAERLAAKKATALDEAAVRKALQALRRPPRGVGELVSSPLSFMALTDAQGRVLARDSVPDRMKGQDFAQRFPSVAQSLKEAKAKSAIAEFAGERGEKASYSWLFSAPVMEEGRPQGAFVLGIPLWRLAQRLSRQLQLEHAKDTGLIVWAYVYKGDVLYHHGTPPELDKVLPRAAVRSRALQSKPRKAGGHFELYGRDYAWHLLPTPWIAPDMGLLLVRSNPS